MTRATLVLAALFAVPNSTMADPWGEFMARCVLPLERIEAPDTTGMIILGKWPHLAYWKGESIGMFVAVETAQLSCSGSAFYTLGDLAPAVDFMDQALAHFESQVDLGRYIEVGSSSEQPDYVARTIALHSLQWREPVLEVVIHVHDGGSGTVRVEETDLES